MAQFDLRRCGTAGAPDGSSSSELFDDVKFDIGPATKTAFTTIST